jgi:chromosome segregation ATPase
MDSDFITAKELAERDFIISELTEVLERRRKELLERYRELNRIKKETGKEDDEYKQLKKYYDHIISTKEKQNDAFLDIMKHLEKIKEVELSTEENLNNALRYKNEIVKEKDKLREEIDEIIAAEN